MRRPKLSIIIPICNAGNLIEQTYRAVRDVFPGAEILVVDDVSSDSSLDIVQKLARLDPFLKVFPLKKKAGQHLALFIGLYYVKGDIVITTDDDLSVHPSAFLKALEHLEQSKNKLIILTYSKTDHGWGSQLFNLLYRKMWGVNHNGSNHKVFSAELLPDLMPYFSEDLFLDNLLMHATDRVGFVPVEFNSKTRATTRYSYFSKAQFALNNIKHYLFFSMGSSASKKHRFNHSLKAIQSYTQ
jgi:glycosyltransferase involved in cell wall biosynthesis